MSPRTVADRHVSYRDRDGNQARIAYRRAGHGPAVVLIHGVGLQGAVWTPQIQALRADHDVIAVDMPGHGGSSLPPADPRLAYYADAILALLDGLGISRAHVVGHSMGALVAIEFALDHPGRVMSLVALNAVFCRTPEQRAAIESRVAALSAAPARPDWSGTLRRWFGDPVPDALQAAAGDTRALLAGIEPTGYERSYRLFARSDAVHRDSLTRLAVPVLFATGEHDPNSTPGMSEALARLAPNGRAIVIPGARHMMTLTDADCISRMLRDFIDRGSPTATTGEPANADRRGPPP